MIRCHSERADNEIKKELMESKRIYMYVSKSLFFKTFRTRSTKKNNIKIGYTTKDRLKPFYDNSG